MKFLLINTESYSSVSAKYVKMLTESDEFKNKARYSEFYEFDNPLFEIDLDSLDQLISLEKLVGREIIVCETHVFNVATADGKEVKDQEVLPPYTLEIYDGYRE